MYVYLITNLINNKKYVGISNNYKKRWSNECNYSNNTKNVQLIQKKIKQYGKENFKFEVLFSHLSIEDACQKEYELIEKYHTWVNDPLCWGYNVDRGGKFGVGGRKQNGELNNNSKITDNEAQYILDHRNIPEYVLYEEFIDKISYDEFKSIYNGKKFQHLTTTTQIYPYNLEFSCQFIQSALEYDEVIDIRIRYNNREYWRSVYKDYSNKYNNEMSFWNAYNGITYSLVMPEVFTKENKHYHSGLSKSGNKNGRAKLTKEDVLNIREMNKNGIENKEIYKKFPQVSQVSIRNIINNKTWVNI